VLIRFEVANFRSVLEPVELSMVAIDRHRPEARDVPNLGESLLTVAGIYGPNASGKTNVIAAMAWLQTAVRDSLRSWDDEIPVEPFAFFGGEGRPTEFVAELVVDGVRFEYVIEFRGYVPACAQASCTARTSSGVGRWATPGRYCAAISTRRSLTSMSP
jgi:hypothetical protein